VILRSRRVDRGTIKTLKEIESKLSVRILTDKIIMRVRRPTH